MVDRDRVAILWVPYAELIGLLMGKCRIVGLPEDAVISGVGSDFRKKSIGLRVLSNSFRKIGQGETVGSLFFDTLPFKTEPIHPDVESAILTEIERLRADLRDVLSDKANKPVDAVPEAKTHKEEDWHSVMRRWEEEFRLLQAAYPSQNIPLQEVGA